MSSTGTDNIDVIRGTSGDDTIDTNGGRDWVTAGADTIYGDAGDDTMTGGAGADTFVFGGNSGNDAFPEPEAGAVQSLILFVAESHLDCRSIGVVRRRQAPQQKL